MKRVLGSILPLLLLAGIAFSTAACKTKRVIERSPLINISDNALVGFVEANVFDFKTLNAKLSVSADSEDQNGSFKVNMRVAQDSVVWMSITPALGIEALRMVVDQDSIRYVNKIKGEYYLGGIDLMDTILAYAGSYSFLENLLVGNPVEMYDDEKYTAIVDGLNYVLQTKSKRKLRKAVDLGGLKSSEDSTYTDVLKAKKYDKVTKKYSEDDLILKRYYVRPGDFKIEKIFIDDILLKRSLRIYYSRFEPLDGTAFPMNIRIEISAPGSISKFELDYTRVKTNEPQTYPFRIPEKYSKIP